MNFFCCVRIAFYLHWLCQMKKNALQWIEEYVILEIQILLRHSDMTIKQIAYEMNFCDQSFLGKYFKRITGMSPEQYRNL